MEESTLEQKVSILEENSVAVLERLKSIDGSISQIVHVLQKMDEKIETQGKQLDVVTNSLKSLQGNSTTTLETMEKSLNDLHKNTHEGFSGLTEEIRKIGVATRYDEDYKNFLQFPSPKGEA